MHYFMPIMWHLQLLRKCKSWIRCSSKIKKLTLEILLLISTSYTLQDNYLVPEVAMFETQLVDSLLIRRYVIIIAKYTAYNGNTYRNMKNNILLVVFKIIN